MREEVMSDEDVIQPHTPRSSEEEVYFNQYAPQLMDDDELVEEDDPIDVDEEEPVPPKTPKKLPQKRPREPVVEELSDYESSAIGDGDIVKDVPDLHAYFAFFRNFPEVEQVKMCRSYATYLSSKNPKNRLRFNTKTTKSGYKK